MSLVKAERSRQWIQWFFSDDVNNPNITEIFHDNIAHINQDIANTNNVARTLLDSEYPYIFSAFRLENIIMGFSLSVSENETFYIVDKSGM